MYLVNTVVVALVSIAFMLAISPRVTAYALLPLPLVSLCVWYFGERIERRFEAIQQRFAAISAKVQENLAGARVVRAFTREGRERAEFRELNQDYLNQNLELLRTSGLFYPSLAFLSGAAALLALYLGGREVVGARMTLGQFVAFTVYLGMLNWPMVALGWVINLFQRGSASLRRIGEILDVVPAIASPPAALAPSRCAGEIEFHRLTFAYPGAPAPTLSEISFRVPTGGLVALVGRTGSGKSTIAALLPRAFDPPAGAVTLDGLDVRAYDLGWLRAHIAWVPQDTFLFSATVAENIAYGQPGASRESVERAAAIAGLEDDLRGFPAGLDTRVGERGITLSGGQKQRVAIARAVLLDAPVLLLDDCLSSVDTPDRGARPERAARRDAAAHDAAGLAPREHGARRRPDPGARARPRRRARPPRRSCSRSADGMPRCAARSSSKRSWRPREPEDEAQRPRVRPPADAPPAGLPAPVPAGRWRSRCVVVIADAVVALVVSVAHQGGDRPRHPPPRPALPRPGRGGLPGAAARSASGSATCRTRSCSASGSTSCSTCAPSCSATSSALPVSYLRPPSDRTAHDARHQRRRRAERAVHRRRGRAVRRPVRADRHRDRDEPAQRRAAGVSRSRCCR